MSKTSTTGSNISSGSPTTLEESPPKMISFLETTPANGKAMRRAEVLGLEPEIVKLAEEKEKTKVAESSALKALAAEREVLAMRLKAAEERERQAKAKMAQGQKEREAYSLQLKSLEKRQKVNDQNQKTLMKSISENKDISMTDFASNMQTNNKKMAKTVKSAQTRKRVSVIVYMQVTDIRDIQLTIFLGLGWSTLQNMETKKKVTSTNANSNNPNKKKVCQFNTTVLLSIFCSNAKTLILQKSQQKKNAKVKKIEAYEIRVYYTQLS